MEKALTKPQIPWSDALIETLFEVVILKKAHITPNGQQATKVWTEVNKVFYMQDAVKHLKPLHFAEDKFRKLCEKYNEVYRSTVQNKNYGNQSGKEGDLSKLFKLVQQVDYDLQVITYCRIQMLSTFDVLCRLLG